MTPATIAHTDLIASAGLGGYFPKTQRLHCWLNGGMAKQPIAWLLFHCKKRHDVVMAVSCPTVRCLHRQMSPLVARELNGTGRYYAHAYRKAI